MKRTIRILIAHPHVMFRDALRHVLGTEPDMSVVGEAATGRDALEQLRRLRPDILLLDIAGPDIGGVAVLRELSGRNDPVFTLVLMDGAGHEQSVAALKHGARGILPRRATASLLYKSIRAVVAGEYWVGHEHIRHLVNHIRAGELPRGRLALDRPRKPLTARELEVVASLVDGATNKDIAQKLSISEQSVKHHLTRVYGKVGVSTRLELALFALQQAKHSAVLPPA